MKRLVAILQDKMVGIVFTLAIATGAFLFNLHAAVAIQDERVRNYKETQDRQYVDLYERLETIRKENREEHGRILDLLNKK